MLSACAPAVRVSVRSRLCRLRSERAACPGSRAPGSSEAQCCCVKVLLCGEAVALHALQARRPPRAGRGGPGRAWSPEGQQAPSQGSLPATLPPGPPGLARQLGAGMPALADQGLRMLRAAGSLRAALGHGRPEPPCPPGMPAVLCSLGPEDRWGPPSDGSVLQRSFCQTTPSCSRF